MSGQWKPGDVAMVTYGSARTGRAVFVDECEAIGHSRAPHWHYFDGRRHTEGVLAESIRPLVVIDPEDAEAVGRLVRIMEDRAGGRGALNGSPMLDMTLVLREFANPTPPKPDEPLGLGAVVRDSEGEHWIRTGEHGTRGHDDWHHAGAGDHDWRTWAEIDATEVLSEGIQS